MLVKNYRNIVLIYIAMQLSSIIGFPITKTLISPFIGDSRNIDIYAVGYWNVFIFTVALIFVLLLLKNEMDVRSFDRKQWREISLWGFGGVFLAFFSQSVGIQLESMLGIDPGSENTRTIIFLIEHVPLLVVVSSIIGPILEEIVFRKIIFGTLYQKFNFAISALISSVIFALAHLDFPHIILYTMMGFVFSFLYVQTRKIIVPIIAHVLMNTLVVVIQFLYKDEIENMSIGIKYIQTLLEVFH